MVGVAQLVRASDCGSECRGFESPHPPLYLHKARVCGPYAFCTGYISSGRPGYKGLAKRHFDSSLPHTG